MLFGGRTSAGLSNETWTWDGSAWTQHTPAIAPSPRRLHAMTWDSARQRVVLSGGSDGASVLGDTWEWDGHGWIAQAPTLGHGARYAHALGYDAQQRVILFGGRDPASARLGDTWAYAPSVRGRATGFGSGCRGSSGIPVLGASGPPIVGNRDFAIEVSNVPPGATAFVAFSCTLGMNQVFGPCTVYPLLPFLSVQQGSASASGIAEIPIPIPFNVALSGVNIYAQGGAIDPNGAMLGVVSLTPGLQILIGD